MFLRKSLGQVTVARHYKPKKVFFVWYCARLFVTLQANYRELTGTKTITDEYEKTDFGFVGLGSDGGCEGTEDVGRSTGRLG